MKNFCCESFAQANQEGTDNEMYCSAVYKYRNESYIGTINKPIRFCPWCGAELKQPTACDPNANASST